MYFLPATTAWEHLLGEVLVFKRVYLINDDFKTILNEIRFSDYLGPVTRSTHPEAEKVIYVNGLEYIQIYKVADIPESVYEALLQKQRQQ
ncbi:MAG: hypothetical protein IH588_18200 [Anaerolineales bacterium]|nr:hypothetical protein [Anaerolineales bacterium]